MPKKKKSSIFKSNLYILFIFDKFHPRLLRLDWSWHIIIPHVVNYLIVDALGSHLISCKDCAALSRNCIVLMSLSLSLRMTIVLISLPSSLLFKYKEDNISIRKFWVTRILVTVDSSSFLLIMLSFTLNGKFELLLLFFQNKKLECQKRMSLWTFCGKE